MNKIPCHRLGNLRDNLILFYWFECNNVNPIDADHAKKHAHAKTSNKYIPRQASTAQWWFLWVSNLLVFNIYFKVQYVKSFYAQIEML